MDDMDGVFSGDDPPACGSSIIPTRRPSSGAIRVTPSDRLRPDDADPGCAGYGYAFAANVLARRPPDPTTGGVGRTGTSTGTSQEVMTGASRADWLRYRALWFSLLSQGFLRAGTANSDSHSLAVERIGYPRNLVWGDLDKTRPPFIATLRRRRARRPPRGDQRSGPRRHHRRRHRSDLPPRPHQGDHADGRRPRST